MKKRRIYSEYLKKILDRIPKVVNKEKEEIEEKLKIVDQLIEMDKVDDEEDISEIIKQIEKFYDSAHKIHIGAVVKTESTLIKECKKNVYIIYKSINYAKQALECDDYVESLLRLSKDPLSGLTEFTNLLEKTNSDLLKVKLEIEKRMQKELENTSFGEYLGYKEEKDKLNHCRSILEEMSK